MRFTLVHATMRYRGVSLPVADLNVARAFYTAVGFTYGPEFADPDGRIWGAVWMDMSAMPNG